MKGFDMSLMGKYIIHNETGKSLWIQGINGHGVTCPPSIFITYEELDKYYKIYDLKNPNVHIETTNVSTLNVPIDKTITGLTVPPIKLAPFNYYDWKLLIQKTIIRKVQDPEDRNVFVIIGANLDGIFTIIDRQISFIDLMENYMFDDGSPCGKEDEYPITFKDILENKQDEQVYINKEHQKIYWHNKTLCTISLDKKTYSLTITHDIVNSQFKKLLLNK